MSKFDLLQYGYLGLLAFMVIVGSQLVKRYLSLAEPPKKSVFILSMFFLLSVTGGFSGYLWASKELEVSQKQNLTAATIQQEISNARNRLNSAVMPLHEARNKALEQSVYGGNLAQEQEKNRIKALAITEMIEMHENNFENELSNIATAYSSLGFRNNK